MFIEDCIDKIAMLEKRVGAVTPYEILQPFTIDTGDAIAIQNAAKKIADFVGLNNFTFIVGLAKAEEGVGGHIELEQGVNTLYIEISKDMKKFPDAVPALLAHEITHKYLETNGISCGTGPTHQYENEVLTDITTIFLGLGKLVLNGCEGKNIRQESLKEETRTITETMKTGYLDRNQFAFVYRLVCAMRQIPAKVCEAGLSFEALQALRQCELQYSPYFDKRFNDTKFKSELVERVDSTIRSVQPLLANVDKGLLYIQKGYVDVSEAFLKKVHKRLYELTAKSKIILNDDQLDPCLKYINALRANEEIGKLNSEIKEFASQGSEYERAVLKLVNLVQDLGSPFLPPQSEMFNVVVCHNDGTKLSLPKNKRKGIAKCPKCHYEFTADTSQQMFSKPSGKVD